MTAVSMDGARKAPAGLTEMPGDAAISSSGIITLLSDYADEVLLDEAVLATAFHVVPRTIRRMVNRYELPPPLKIASRNRWTVGSVRSWLHDRIRAGEQEAKSIAHRIGRM